jgi:hypothetical protein
MVTLGGDFPLLRWSFLAILAGCAKALESPGLSQRYCGRE